jgi:hypothetical protein
VDESFGGGSRSRIDLMALLGEGAIITVAVFGATTGLLIFLSDLGESLRTTNSPYRFYQLAGRRPTFSRKLRTFRKRKAFDLSVQKLYVPKLFYY